MNKWGGGGGGDGRRRERQNEVVEKVVSELRRDGWEGGETGEKAYCRLQGKTATSYISLWLQFCVQQVQVIPTGGREIDQYCKSGAEYKLVWAECTVYQHPVLSL